MVKLAEATNAEKIMVQKLDQDYGEMGKIDYQFVALTDSVKDKERARWIASYLVDFDCFYFEAPPFVFKPTPFEPHLCIETCGDAGYDYYVE